MRTLFNLVVKLVILAFILMAGFVGMAFYFSPPPMSDAEKAAAAAQREARNAEAQKEIAAIEANTKRLNEERKAYEAIEAAKPRMNSQNYSRCRAGMTYDEIVAIVGPPSSELASSEIAGISTVMYQWDAGFVANANMIFQNGKMVQKAQFGL